MAAPVGLTVFFPRQHPLPDKVVGQIPEPIDVDEVDAHVRTQMQTALDRPGHERRLPLLG